MSYSFSALVLNMSRLSKRMVALSVDIVLCFFTVALAHFLRLDHWAMPVGSQWIAYFSSVIFALPLFVSFGLYRAIFRYVGWGALMSVARACALYALLYSMVFSFVGVTGVPRAVGLIQPILLFLTIGSSRAFARYWLGGGYKALLRVGQPRRVLIYGAGSSGRQLAAGIASSQEMQIVGFVDDDPTLQGSVLNGKRIYPSRNLRKLIEQLDVADLLLAIPSASRQRRNEIIESVRGTPAAIRTLPGLMDLAHGRVMVSDLRELDIEDLLGRETVPPNRLLLSRNISGKTVMVTGAGGSIGSELCRQIISMRPDTIVFIEQSEFNLYTILQEVLSNISRDEENKTQVVSVLGSVHDVHRMEHAFSTWKPDTIYHAAAYKHVPLVEDNPTQGVINNVFGTLTISLLAEKYKAKDFVLISTDKAVRPTNIMGATKRLAEQILQAINARGSDTRFSMVRFGNVLGSSGSVVPLFRTQIRSGGPVTITHQDITRYFMTIPEAAQLVIQAGAMAVGGEVFVLDMGTPVKVMDLARRMIELSGLAVRDVTNPDGDIEIKVVGLRPGEKLYEELLIGDDSWPTKHQKIMKANENFTRWNELAGKLERLLKSAQEEDVASLLSILSALVPEFKPTTVASGLTRQGMPLRAS